MSGPTGARPTGVTVVAVLALIAGVLGLVATASIFGLGGRTAAFSGVITLAISLADLAMGYGFWMLRPWSWKLAFALVFISPVWEIVRWLYRGADPLNLVVAIVFHLCIEYSMNLFLFHWIMILGLLSFAEFSELRWPRRTRSPVIEPGGGEDS